MLKFYTLIVVLSAIILTMPSCLKDDENCTVSSDCYTSKIDSGDVAIRITYGNGQSGVPVTLYRGYAENNDVIWHDTVYQDEVVLYMPVGQRYAAEAEYKTAAQTIVALDGKKLKQDKHRECGTTCYDFPSVSLDCRKL